MLKGRMKCKTVHKVSKSKRWWAICKAVFDFWAFEKSLQPI